MASLLTERHTLQSMCTALPLKPASPLRCPLQMALRAVGLALAYYSTWMMPVAFAGVSGILLTSLISPSIQE
jgi:hypothetical protein